ncbi:MAG: recombination protein NinG [Pseudomonadales bacterium]|jgi:predicted RNA-binding Zn-ribbon protein involved in translation (DUF1610 family)|nr:recombination protein NinG [Pseudomonadales bacterium]
MKRTPLRRRALKPRCAHCGDRFEPPPEAPGIRHCSADCGLALYRIRAEKERAAKAREAKRKRSEIRKAAQRSRRDSLTFAQVVSRVQSSFNRMIRLRDQIAGHPCPTCGRPPSVVELDPPVRGGVWDAGHYHSVGSHPELRFDEDNAHRQCKSCNRPGGHRRLKYRDSLIERLGQDAVDRLDGPHPQAKWTRDELWAMKAEFDRRARELQRRAAEACEVTGSG